MKKTTTALLCFLIGCALVALPVAYYENRPDPVRDAARDYDLAKRDDVAAQALRCFGMADRFKQNGDPRTAARWHSEGLRLARIAGKGLPTK